MDSPEVTALLPAIFRRTIESLSPEQRRFNPLGALVDVIAMLITRLEDPLTNLTRQFNPVQADPRFVLYLAEWLGMSWLGELAGAQELDALEPPLLRLDALRMVLAAAPVISSWRGTARGLSTFLNLATSCDGFAVRETGQPFEMEVLVPTRAASSLRLIEAIVEHEKPAHSTWKPVMKTENPGDPSWHTSSVSSQL